MEQTPSPLSPNEAAVKILAIYDMVMRLGANDEEFGTFKEMLDGLKEGTVTPEKSLKTAQSILKRKQDYH